MSWYRRFLPYVRPESRGLATLLALTVLGVALEALLPWPLKLVVDNVLGGQPMPDAARWLEALPYANSAGGMLAWLAFGVLVVYFAAQGLRLVKALVEARIAARMRIGLGAALLERLHELSIVYHRRSRRGDQVRRVTTDSACLPNLVTGAVLPVVSSALSLVVLFTIMWQLDVTLALLALAVAMPMGLLMRLLAPRMADRAYEHQEAEGRLWSVAEQTLTALPMVQGFSRETDEKTRFSGVADRSVRTYMRALVSEIQFQSGVDACEAAGIALVMLVGGIHVLQGSLSVGTLIVFFSYLAALYAPLVTFVYLASNVATALGSARRVAEVLDAADRIEDSPGARPLAMSSPRGARIRFEAVGFSYVAGRPVLKDVSLDIAAGETVALIGATGAGKTTLVSLVPRLVNVSQGRVLIEEHDVRHATLASVRSACALVLQDAFLLPVTVAQNIAYGKPSASRIEVERVARAAGVHEFIERLENGYDTPVGERGITLSAGQRQRIAIARALLKESPILIMDEPTSALDTGTEDFVLHAMQPIIAGRTTLVIAHRLSTIRHVDRVIVLDHGEIAAVGTHEALLQSSALYRTLYLTQLTPLDGGVVQA